MVIKISPGCVLISGTMSVHPGWGAGCGGAGSLRAFSQAAPAAFTLTTGKDHWETLIRARAIENGLYMVASAQTGQHPPGNWCYGRSMVVDPWGTVVTTASDGVGVAQATIDPVRIATVRRQVPSLANRRPEAYRWPEESTAFATRH